MRVSFSISGVFSYIILPIWSLQCPLPEWTGKPEEVVTICAMCSDTDAAMRWRVREGINLFSFLLSYRCYHENGTVVYQENLQDNDDCFVKWPNWLEYSTGTVGIGQKLWPGLLCQFGTGYTLLHEPVRKVVNCTIRSTEECEEYPDICIVDRYSKLDEDTKECVYECADGFDGDQCNNINECEGKNACIENATCIDTDGSYWCQCLPGSHKDQNNHCKVDCTNGSACGENAECSVSTLNCQCKPGFTGNGYNCEDNDECAEESPVCPEGSYCINTVGSYSCNLSHGEVNVLVIAAVATIVLLILLGVIFAILSFLYCRFKVIAGRRRRSQRGFSKF